MNNSEPWLLHCQASGKLKRNQCHKSTHPARPLSLSLEKTGPPLGWGQVSQENRALCSCKTMLRSPAEEGRVSCWGALGVLRSSSATEGGRRIPREDRPEKEEALSQVSSRESWKWGILWLCTGRGNLWQGLSANPEGLVPLQDTITQWLPLAPPHHCLEVRCSTGSACGPS